MAPTEGKAGGLSQVSCRANWKTQSKTLSLFQGFRKLPQADLQGPAVEEVGAWADRLPTFTSGFAPTLLRLPEAL